MKRILSIFKDLQNSGQQATIIGHFSLQIGNFQEVANIDSVHERTETTLFESDTGKNANRYTTEHDRGDVEACHSVSVALHSDLLEVIGIWQKFPDSIKTGILAMAKTTSCLERNRNL